MAKLVDAIYLSFISRAYSWVMKRGPKPGGKIKIVWSADFAYAIGLLTADGCLSKDRRHIDFTSKDKPQAILFKKCLGIKTKIGIKYSGSGRLAYRVQCGDVLFYKFLMSIGLTPAKSKTIQHVLVPDKYFSHFLRGYFDGDGTSYSFYDSVFSKSYRFYVSFLSASPPFIHWLREQIYKTLGILGHLNAYSGSDYLQLKFAKRESIIICNYMYGEGGSCLKRKHLKIQQSMSIIKRCRGGEIGNRATFRS